MMAEGTGETLVLKVEVRDSLERSFPTDSTFGKWSHIGRKYGFTILIKHSKFSSLFIIKLFYIEMSVTKNVSYTYEILTSEHYSFLFFFWRKPKHKPKAYILWVLYAIKIPTKA